MNKKAVGAIVAGVGVTAAVGMMAMKKTKGMRQVGRAYSGVMGMKDEFANELGSMAKRAGKTMIKVGRTMDRIGR